MRTTFTDPDLQSRFSRTGYAVVPMLSADGVARLAAAVDQLKPADGFDPANNATSRVTYHCSFLDSDLSYKRREYELVRQTFDPFLERYLDNYRILMSNIFIKPPGTGRVASHQNWPSVTDLDDTTVTIWVPLVDVVGSNGALQIIEGSHKIVPHIETPSSQPYFEAIREAVLEPYLEPIPMAAGQGLIFDDSLIHRSADNSSNERRMAIQITCIAADATPAFFIKEGEERFELIAADTDFYLDQSAAELLIRDPAWSSLGFVPNRNRMVDAGEFEWLMANRAEIRAAGQPTWPPASASSSASRFQRLLTRVGR